MGYDAGDRPSIVKKKTSTKSTFIIVDSLAFICYDKEISMVINDF